MAVGEWDHRQLCPDGSCIGLIGPDGTCKVCGHAAPNWGDERRRGLVASTDAATDDDDDDYEDEDDEEYEDDEGDEDDDEVDPIAPSAPASLGSLAEWSERKLCPDGACIGLLGDDGKCKVCGTVGSAAKPRVSAASTTTSTATSSEDASLEAAAAELAAVVSPEAVEAIAPAPSIEADDEADRKLCPDGACVGVIGSDGRCKVCGKEAE